jgi:hypothetical protein
MEVQLGVTTEIAKAISDAASRLASGALSAIHAGATVGYSANDSNQASRSINSNDSLTTEYIHNYNNG